MRSTLEIIRRNNASARAGQLDAANDASQIDADDADDADFDYSDMDTMDDPQNYEDWVNSIRDKSRCGC